MAFAGRQKLSPYFMSRLCLRRCFATHGTSQCRGTSLATLNGQAQKQSHPSSVCINRIINNTLSRSYHKNLEREVKAISALILKTTRTKKLCSPELLFKNARSFSTSQNNNQQSQNDPNQDNKEDPEEEKAPFLARLMMIFWVSFLLYAILRFQTGEENSIYKFVSWNEFLHEMLAKGEVEEILVRPEAEIAFIRVHPGAIVKGRPAESEVYTLKIVDPDKFEDKVRRAEAELGVRPEAGVPISYKRESSLVPIVFMAIIGLALFLVFRNMVKIQMPNPADMFASERKARFVRADQMPSSKGVISFKDVAGLHEAKLEVMEFVDYLKQPQRYKSLGARIPKGALLTGPPGCGKTLLAKAVASEAKVPFLAMAGSEFVEMLGGLGAARVRDLFKEARQKAPCIIYVDEIDAIGRRRTGEGGSAGSTEEEHTLNQLLVEMDGMDTTEGVIMLSSTNRAHVLDKALLRPGRFDRHIDIGLPTLAERKEIFEMYLRKLKIAQSAPTYSDSLSQLSPGMSGADIANICNEAALYAARNSKKVIDSSDFDYAVERVIAGVAKKSRVLSPQEKRVVAYHEAGHAVVGWLLKHTDALLKVSIVPRTTAALGFAQYMPSDRKLYSKDEIFERMCMALGGRVAESLTFNRVTSGAQDDLRRVTDMAYRQVKQLGMNDAVGHLSFPQGEQDQFATKPYSKKLATIIDQESQKLVSDSYKVTETLLRQHKEKLRVVAEALLEKESLSYSDMEELIGPPPFGEKRIINEAPAI